MFSPVMHDTLPQSTADALTRRGVLLREHLLLQERLRQLTAFESGALSVTDEPVFGIARDFVETGQANPEGAGRGESNSTRIHRGSLREMARNEVETRLRVSEICAEKMRTSYQDALQQILVIR